MALLIAGLIAAGAAVGSLMTYSGTKIFSDSPTTSHVQTIVKNEIAAHVDADDDHETFQNNIITILIGAVSFVLVLVILYFAIIGIKAVRRNRNNTNNNNNNNHNMHAINIDV